MGKKERRKKEWRRSRLAQREHKGQWRQGGGPSAVERGMASLQRNWDEALENAQEVIVEALWDALEPVRLHHEVKAILSDLPQDRIQMEAALPARLEPLLRNCGPQRTEALSQLLYRLLSEHSQEPRVVRGIEVLLALLRLEPSLVWNLLLLLEAARCLEGLMGEEAVKAPKGEYALGSWLAALKEWFETSSQSPLALLGPEVAEALQGFDAVSRFPPETFLYASLNWWRRSQAGRLPQSLTEEEWREVLEAILFETDFEEQYGEVYQSLGEALAEEGRALREQGKGTLAEALERALGEWWTSPPYEQPVFLALYLSALLEWARREPQDDIEAALRESLESPEEVAPGLRALLLLVERGEASRAQRLLACLEAIRPEADWDEVRSALGRPETLRSLLATMGLGEKGGDGGRVGGESHPPM